MEFAKRKAMTLSAMAGEGVDKSPKGSLDVPILPLLDAINAHPSYFTTSSCSGRISILPHAAPNDQNNHNKKKKNKAGDWVFITHEFADPEAVSNLLFNPSSSSEGSQDTMVFRFEPFILAVDCIDVASAHSLVSMAICCGFRESGISSVSKRIMVAIRCSIRLEVPLGEMGRIMVSPEYVKYLVGIANEKMAANRKRTDAFLGLFTASKAAADARPVENDDTPQECMEEGNVLDLEARQLESLSSTGAAVPDAPLCCDVQSLHHEEGNSEDNHNNKEIKSWSSSNSKCSVSANKMKILDLPMGKLFRWGHSAILLNDSDSKKILAFGGFGGIGRHSRQNDSLLLDPTTGILKVLCAVDRPSPRIGHTSSVIGNRMFVIGGRGDPTQIFSDVWVLHTGESRWEILSCTGSVFGPRWERLGNIVVLPSLAFNHKTWDSVSAELWPIVARSLGAARLARQGKVASTGTRDSTLEILVGDNGWVDHHENGILYSFDSTKCMFSWGNLSEKLRLSRLDCRNEIVVDLFAGIGYFVLPFLLKAGAKLVYACEWNPYALEALRKNVASNFVSDRCIILDGDNRIVAPQGVADRVCLGLLPTSEDSWPTAVRALKPQGGVLHVHGNVMDSEEDSWSLYVVRLIQEIAKSEGRHWKVQVEHLERVKWYAPHIRHLVADIKCSLALG